MRTTTIGEDRHHRWTASCAARRNQPATAQALIVGMRPEHKAGSRSRTSRRVIRQSVGGEMHRRSSQHLIGRRLTQVVARSRQIRSTGVPRRNAARPSERCTNRMASRQALSIAMRARPTQATAFAPAEKSGSPEIVIGFFELAAC